MVGSLFTSSTFILTESSFIIVASIAAYELILGDFVSQKSQPPQASTQNRGGGRGRPGYGSFQPNELQQQPAHHGHNRERGGDATTATRVTEQGYYAIPNDRRYASPGRGSSGDATRRMFYKFILSALLSRFMLLPIETIIIDQENVPHSNIPISSAQLPIILRISQTLPDTIFASALGLLIVFCAQIAFSAMPPLSPQSGEASVQGEEDADDAVEEDITERDGLLDEGVNKRAVNRLKTASRMARSLCISGARLSRTIFASKKTFSVFNFILFISYTLVFAAALAHPQRSPSEISLWILMITIYSFLLLSLVYVAILLAKALFPGIVRRGSVDPLALRLVGTCSLLAVMLVTRLVWFSVAAHHALKNMNIDSYRRDTVEYAISEPLPVLLILYMMHRKRKEVQNDVLIIHSIMNNLFGSTTQLDSTNNTPAAAQSGDGAGTGPGARVGGLGSRRFQTYGGQPRGDSFPPASEYKPRRNIPRAVSSSGGRPKQQP